MACVSIDDFGTGYSSLGRRTRCRSTRSRSTSRSWTSSEHDGLRDDPTVEADLGADPGRRHRSRSDGNPI